VDWDAALAVSDEATLTLTGAMVSVRVVGDGVWRVRTPMSEADVLVDRDAARIALHPSLPADPLVLRLRTPLTLLARQAPLEAWIAVPVQIDIEAVGPRRGQIVHTVVPPDLARWAAIGPVDSALLARSVPVELTPGPLPADGPPGRALLPLRIRTLPQDDTRMERLRVPGDAISLFSRGERLVAGRLEVEADGEAFTVTTAPQPPEDGLLHRFGPSDGITGSFSGRLRRLARRGLGLEYGR
jgi:hypothetical protein